MITLKDCYLNDNWFLLLAFLIFEIYNTGWSGPIITSIFLRLTPENKKAYTNINCYKKMLEKYPLVSDYFHYSHEMYKITIDLVLCVIQ